MVMVAYCLEPILAKMGLMALAGMAILAAVQTTMVSALVLGDEEVKMVGMGETRLITAELALGSTFPPYLYKM